MAISMLAWLRDRPFSRSVCGNLPTASLRSRLRSEPRALASGFPYNLAAVCTFALLAGTAIAQTKGGPARKFELKRESPRFWDLSNESSQLGKIATGYGF